ncbi:MAG: hypothetical protein ACOXZ0_05380 [Eubacteriales bacterium]|jgi:hypothetical protein
MNSQCLKCICYIVNVDRMRRAIAKERGKDIGDGHFCLAFQDNPIPQEIWDGVVAHTEPYPGDNGLLFKERVLRDEVRVYIPEYV